MWDWSTSRKTGTIKLDLRAGRVVTGARFVNELYERVLILAGTSEQGRFSGISKCADRRSWRSSRPVWCR